jgi:hypothetical protein
MAFLKEHLLMEHYMWNADSSFYQGEPTRRIFNRENGFQVLFLINCCSAFLEIFTIQEGRLIEERIGHQLPHEIKSEVTCLSMVERSFFQGMAW